MKSIFNLDSPVMTILTEIADLIILNLIYLFFCMPIVTIGAATAALYRVMLNYEKGESVNPVRQFWKAFRENWKGATILFLIMLIPMACMLYYFLVIAASIYGGSKLTLVMSCIAALIIMILLQPKGRQKAQNEMSVIFFEQHGSGISASRFRLPCLLNGFHDRTRRTVPDIPQ